MALVINIDQSDNYLTEHTFESIGCSLRREPALERLDARDRPVPSVILIRFQPGRLELLRQIRQFKVRQPSIPLILTDNQHRNRVALWALRARLWDYVMIPKEYDYLLSSIKQLISIQNNVHNPTREMIIPNPPKERLMGPTGNKSSRTAKARYYIESHSNEKIRVETLAELCGMSMSSLLRHFKNEHGVTIRDFIKDCRIAHAQELLCETGLSVKQIAFKVGYEDVSHFIRLFKSEVDVTPVAYRLAYLSEELS